MKSKTIKAKKILKLILPWYLTAPQFFIQRKSHSLIPNVGEAAISNSLSMYTFLINVIFIIKIHTLVCTYIFMHVHYKYI